MEEAFRALRRHARNTNQKLGDAAERLVHGAVPPGRVIDPRP